MAKTYKAFAKINLMLHVTGRRPDGHHMLNSLISFIDLADELRLEKADSFSLAVEGAFAGQAPADDSNLVVRAARLMEGAAGRRTGMAVRLTKNIPAGAGLGGGSADAAVMMHALNEDWGRPFDLPQLQALGLKLGAELPVCLAGSAHFVSGIGEIVHPAQIPSFDAVVAWPGRTLATKDVFSVFGGPFSPPLEMPDQITRAWIDGQRNDLSDAAIQLQPLVRSALNETGGRMSGSGSAVFVLTDDRKSARKLAADLGKRHPAWWVRACRVNAGAGA